MQTVPNPVAARKRVAILQSNYIPWKGYFDLIASVDEFVLYDDMQYTRRDWRNRNQIKTPAGPAWLTVPVKVKGKYFQRILETEIDGDEWSSVHWKTIVQNYRKAPHYEEAAGLLAPHYELGRYRMLSDLNRALIAAVCDYLGIKTRIRSSTEFALVEGKTERLVDLCTQLGASDYVSGPAARDYIDPMLFEAARVRLHWFDYAGYPEYPQLWGPFVHAVSVIDLLFNCGRDAARAMKHVQA